MYFSMVSHLISSLKTHSGHPSSWNLLYQDLYRQHMLSDTLLVPRLVLPYLDQCVRQAKLLCHR